MAELEIEPTYVLWVRARSLKSNKPEDTSKNRMVYLTYGVLQGLNELIRVCAHVRVYIPTVLHIHTHEILLGILHHSFIQFFYVTNKV